MAGLPGPNLRGQPMISFKVNTRSVTKLLSDLKAKQLPFAISTALNDVAFTAQAGERAVLPSVFHNPRPFTRKSVMVVKASKANLEAQVFIRPDVAVYLAPYEFGGVHAVPGAAQLVPVKMRLDQYGQITQVTLKRLNALADNPASGIFFGEMHGVRGYWLRPKVRFDPKRAAKGQAQPRARLTLIAKVEQPVAVHEHLDFIPNVEHQIAAAWPDAFQRAMDKATATARP